MANEKQLNARLVQKHDTEANWNKATNFIPKDGEIIVYDIDNNYDYKRIKIGDGITNVINLPFFTTSSNIIDNITSIEYELNVDNGVLSHNIVSEYTEFTITKDNRADIGYTTETTDLVIPSAFVKDGITYKVTSIGGGAFDQCDNLVNVTIPNGVTSIGNSAFSWCDILTSVTIPDSVVSIGKYAFECCPNLTNIIIPNSVTSIGDSAFSQCTSLTEVIIPKNMTTISKRMFSNCTNLTSVTIPDSVTDIGDSAFNTCPNLTNIIIPNNVTSIGTYAFGGCSSLTNIIIPDSVTNIGNYAFIDCPNLTNLTIGRNVPNIGNGVFWGCGKLVDITIPNSITSIGDNAFSSTNLTTIYYEGTKEEWDNIVIGANPTPLSDNIVFGYVDPSNLALKTDIAQANWNQNDETAPDYIKNRTHYNTKGFAEIIPASTLTPVEPGMFIWPDSISIIAGEEYTITWDGTDYTCTGIEENVDGISAIVLGNYMPVFGGEPISNEPFAICSVSPDFVEIAGFETVIVALDGRETEVNIALSGETETVVKIPNKYISFPITNFINGSSIGSVRHVKAYDDEEHPLGYGAFAEGFQTTASGDHSHAEGIGTRASGDYSHAEGYQTTASGYDSHAEGYYTTASGYDSHAEGSNTKASGYDSHAEGYYTIAASQYQHSQGKYNIEDANEKYAHVVGNGTSTSKRSNAHTLDWNGLGWFAGGLKVGGTSQDDANAKEVALKEDIPDISNLALKTEIPDVDSYITTHNTSIASHNDIRDLITGLTNRLNALADSDDTTLDQLSEIVTYIKSNKELIDAITTSKVNVDDIVNNLTTNVSNKPLSAAQGVALKALIDAITVPTKVSELTNDSGYLTSYTETDPTVPAWAKAANKPTYTADEVGADASGTANSAVSTHNTSTDAHNDIREELANKMNQGDNADSATKLQTARTINGIAFDGTADIVVPSYVKIGTITLTADGWVEDATLGAFKQAATIPNLANGHKVDLDADLNTINQLPASIVPYNDNGTFYAVTLTPPSVDIAVQYTLLATN